MLTTLSRILSRRLRIFEYELLMNKKSWLTGLFIILLSSIAVLVRIYYVNALMTEVNISENIYNAAKVSIDTNGLKSAFSEGIHIKSFYICNLYLAFLIFGKFYGCGRLSEYFVSGADDITGIYHAQESDKQVDRFCGRSDSCNFSNVY